MSFQVDAPLHEESVLILQMDGTRNASLDPTSNPSTRFCLPWNISSDEWWTHHVAWEISEENDEKYCFSPIVAGRRKSLLESLYEVQFTNATNCSATLTKNMWSSGWGADFSNVIDGLVYALEMNRPFQVNQELPWHYASKKDGSQPVCPEKSMDCYFLPISSCGPSRANLCKRAYYTKTRANFNKLDIRTYMEYAARQQTWLRKEVYDFSKTVPLTAPCSVVHVRRGDVVLHGKLARRYHSIDEYVHGAAGNLTKTIFLLTDDNNAITEARTKFPNHDWVVIDRPRFKGMEGGWENQIPSNDPKFEVITLLTILKLAPKCERLIHTQSSLADHIYGSMLRARGKDNVDKIYIMNKTQAVYSQKNSDSYTISKSDW